MHIIYIVARSHYNVDVGRPRDSSKSFRVSAYADRSYIYYGAPSGFFVKGNFFNGYIYVIQYKVVEVVEVVEPDPSQVIERNCLVRFTYVLRLVRRAETES
tara:strand:- start:1391 stop:1693 length:303 start_codon:yes stop_codon:yes gene_type:complete